MSRHVDDIKSLLFEEPDFESDEEVKSKSARRKERKRLKKSADGAEATPAVETIVFRDPAKRKKKKGNVSRRRWAFGRTSVVCLETRCSNLDG